jgi:hypothetical protein
MHEIETRQVRRARQRSEVAPKKLGVRAQAGNRATRRAQRKNDDEIIIRPTSLNAVQSCKRSRRDYRIRHKLRPPRGTIHPRTISHHRFIAMRMVSLIFAVAAARAKQRREATAA